MKPTESSEEGHGRVVEGGLQSAGLAVAPVLDPASRRSDLDEGELAGQGSAGGSHAPVRRVSGVVTAAPGGSDLEDAHTTVDAAPARRFMASHAAHEDRGRAPSPMAKSPSSPAHGRLAQPHAAPSHAAPSNAAPSNAAPSNVALSNRIRNALDQTLPLGTPAPDASLFAEARANRVNYSRTMLLGGRYLAELGAAPEPPTRRADPLSQEALTPRAPDLPPTQRMPPGFAGLTQGASQASSPQASSPQDMMSQAGRAPTASPFASPTGLTPQGAAQAARQVAVSEAPREGALRASFVRPVGPPTVPPPRRRRTLPPGELPPGELPPGELPPAELALGELPPGEPTPAGGFWPGDLADEPAPPESRSISPAPHSEEDHVAFALDRPRASSLPPATAEPPRGAAVGATTVVSNGNTAHSRSQGFIRIPDARNPRSNILSNSVILPPPPQPHDFELSSSPSAVPPPSLAYAPTARAPSLAPASAVGAAFAAGAAPVASPALPTTRPAGRPKPALLDLPTADPLAGYEAPRESFWQRSLIVFVVALAVVGLFALGAIAFGFLGKTGW